MSAHPKDGGSAFPNGINITGGLSMRDYFAAHAPITFSDARDVMGLSGEALSDRSVDMIIAVLAHMRRQHADELLEELSPTKSPYADGRGAVPS